MKTYLSTNPNIEALPERNVDLETLFVDYNQYHHPQGKDMFGRLQGW